MDSLVIIIVFLIAIIIAVVVILVILLVRRPNSDRPTEAVVTSIPHAELVVVKGPGAPTGRRYQFRGAEIHIGSDPKCEIRLDDPLVSRQHVTLRYENNRFNIIDNNSAQGTWINRQRVWQSEIPLGTQIEVGTTLIALVDAGQLVDAPAAAPPPATAMFSIEMKPPPGFQLGSRIDKGGQATVFRGTRISDKFPVVIKYLNNMPYNTGGRYFRTKFEQQILIGASIRHPHCVQILTGDAHANPPYMVEEYLDGGTVRERMRNFNVTNSEAIRIIGQVCDALLYLHKRGIVHRDISPNNIMFDNKNEARVIDFGLARIASAPTRSDLGLKVGVAMYMSPEQARGNSSGISPQSDIYSLGIITYEMFTGRQPFSGNDLEILTQQLDVMPVPPIQINPRLSAAISNAIMKALQKEPSQRYANAEDMARAFGYAAPFHTGEVDSNKAATIKSNTVFLGDMPRPIRLQNVDTNAYIPISGKEVVLTRDLVNPNDRTMSRRNGQLSFRDNFWWISELQDAPSANGIYHNELRVVEPQIVSIGDVIRLGNTRLKVMN